MPDKLDIEGFLARMNTTEPMSQTEEFDLTEYLNYKKFANLEEHRDYWMEIRICKIILNDIKSHSTFLEKLSRYCEGIKSLNFSDVKKIRYDAEEESYIVYTHDREYEIYEDDLRFVYPRIIDVPDAAEYEVAIENGGVFVFNKYTEDPPYKVPERIEK